MGVKRVCKIPGCGRLCDVSKGEHYCSLHAYLEKGSKQSKPYFAKTSHEAWNVLYQSPKWKELRREQLRMFPNCQICGSKATEVHHIVPHRGDSSIFFNSETLVSLCHDCHCKETRREINERKQISEKNKNKLWY